MIFSNRQAERKINEGEVYARQRGHDWTEFATVTWVGVDPIGIPHVRFDVYMMGAEERADSRILSIGAFTEMYRPSENFASH